MGASDYVHLDVQFIRQATEKAFQVILRDGTIHWFPKSQVADAENYVAGDRNLTLSVSQWIAEQRGLAAAE